MDGKQRTGAISFRIDREQIRTNSDGSIEVPGRLTRTGIFDYKRGDSTIREFRSDAEVFSEESLDGLRNVLVTKDHPPEFLTSDNWKEHAIGQVSHVAADPPYVNGKLIIRDSAAKHQIEAGFLTEVSCGYACIPQSVDREDADVEQTHISYNHVAIGPPGWSRLGTELRLDSNGQEVITPFEANNKETNMDEIKEAIGPVLDAIKGLEAKYDSLSEALEAKPAEAEKVDSPILHPVDIPAEDTVEEMVDSRARELANLEFRARDAHAELYPDAIIPPKLMGRTLCEEVIRTSDSKFKGSEESDLPSLVREAELIAWGRRNDRMATSRDANSVKAQLSGPIRAKALSTKRSPLRDHAFGVKGN